MMRLRCLLAPLLLAVAGCSGGGSDSATQAGAGGDGISSGAITGFGSVFVNGVRFDTDVAVIMHDDTELNDVRELEVGMIVRVEGNLTSAVASSVRFEEDVKGPVDSRVNDNTLSVLGQTIITDQSTVFNNTSFASIAPGDILEISGLRNADDDIVASFVELKNGDVNRYSVIGMVRNTEAQTFQIDELTVDYSAANVNDLPGGAPTEGQSVEVHDDNKAYVPNSFALAATKVEPQAQLGDDTPAGTRLQIQGIVTNAAQAPAEFEIAGVTVRTSASTRFVFGDSASIVEGARLQVEGTIDNNGVLLASEVKFRTNNTRIEAFVDAVDPGANTVTLLGVPVSVPTGISLSGINPGDYLEVRGFIGANGAFTATRLEREDADSRVRLRSTAEAVDVTAGTVTLLGITVNTNSGTQFEDLGDQRITETEFFNAVIPGATTVQAKWDPFTSVDAPVKEIELED